MAACFAALLPAASARAAVLVTVEPPARALVVFERDRPPAHLPIVAASEGSAACSNVFELEANIRSRSPPILGSPQAAQF